MNYIPEKNIKGQANAVPLMSILKIGQKRICKIKCGEGSGTGFFCNINIDGWNYLRVLITNRHVLNEDEIKVGKKISFSTNNDEQNYEIEMDNKRNIYTSKKYDITIIEIKKEDNIKSDSFFEIDNNIFDPKYNYAKKPIYLLHYPKGKEMHFSQGTIKTVGVDENPYEIEHLCDSDHGSSGAPLINSETNQVIGIHKGGSTTYNFNCATLLKEPIIEFKNQIKNMDDIIKDNKINNLNNNKKEKDIENMKKIFRMN